MFVIQILFLLSFIHLSRTSSSPFNLKEKSDSLRIVYEFGVGVALENIAVRNTGQLLVTPSSSGDLYLLNTVQNGPPVLVNQFNASALAGIAEYSEDVFAVLVSVAKGDSLEATWSVWSVNLQGATLQPDNTLHPPPIIKKITTIPQAPFLNGMSLLSSEQGLILAADALTGVVWLLNVNTGAYSVAINNTITAPAVEPGLPAAIGSAGTNGIHVHAGFLYLTNSGQSTFAKIPITSDGAPINGGSVIARTFNSSVIFDDFALDCLGAGYLVTGPANSIEMVSADGLENQIIAGSLDSTAIAEPTSAVFGRKSSDSNILYVVTDGGLHYPVNGVTIGGQVVAVTTNTQGCFSLDPYF
ncbi:hypothetical protein MMC08_001376 [Hypocenomyce scalaris]|nr:hypothetical protein [Hypocenomyce scalaris]